MPTRTRASLCKNLILNFFFFFLNCNFGRVDLEGILVIIGIIICDKKFVTLLKSVCLCICVCWVRGGAELSG